MLVILNGNVAQEKRVVNPEILRHSRRRRGESGNEAGPFRTSAIIR